MAAPVAYPARFRLGCRRHGGTDEVVLAGGEQDSSLFRFRRLAQNKVYDLLQPDLYYNGGIMRALQVSAIASHYAMKGIAPHTPKADPLIAPFWQVAALAPNLFGLQEFVYDAQSVKPTWHTKIEAKDGLVEIPSGPGLGIDYDLGNMFSLFKTDLCPVFSTVG